MKRLPTLDEIESGHGRDSAYNTGDLDALDAIEAAEGRALDEILERARR